MKHLKEIIIAVVVVLLLVFTGIFVLNAYNSGQIGHKAEKIADNFTEDILGTWSGKYSISQMTFKEEGKTTLNVLGVNIDGEYFDKYDLDKEKHTVTLKYSTAVGIYVEREYDASLENDQLVLIDKQFPSVRMIYRKGTQNFDSEGGTDTTGAQDGDSQDKTSTKAYKADLKKLKSDITGKWESVPATNSGYEFREDLTVALTLVGISYDGTYSVYVEENTGKCVVKITYISVGGVSVSNSYYVSIDGNHMTLAQKGAEQVIIEYNKIG